MKGLAFFDTNILVYSDDTVDAAKQARRFRYSPPIAGTILS